MFWDNFVALCNEIGKAPNTVARELGISSGAVTGWKKGAEPQSARLVQIADYFGVSPDYFSEEKEKSPAPKKGTEDFARVYELLTPEHQEKIQEEILALLKKQMQG